MNDELGFAGLAAQLTGDDGALSLALPDEWRQGRTAYGGLTAGLSLAAAEHASPDLPPLRSMQCAFIGPVGAHPEFSSSLMRQGRNVTSIMVDVNSDDTLVGRTMFFFGQSRESVLRDTFAAPPADDPQTYEDYAPPEIHQMVPKFLQQFEIKLIDGHRPMSGAKEGYIRVWARHRDAGSRRGAASFVTLGDILPPGAAAKLKKWGPISSMNWQMNILTPEVETEDGWWQKETRMTAAQDGYTTQIMRYWNTDGVLVAEGTQCVAVFT